MAMVPKLNTMQFMDEQPFKVVAPFDGIHPRKILSEHNTNIKSVYWQQQMPEMIL